METKKCNNCGEIKLFNSEYFPVRKDSKSGLRATCKVCYEAKRKEYRNANKEKISAKNRVKYLNNREEVIKRSWDYYLNHKEQHVASAKKYYEKNKEQLLAKGRDRYEENKERYKQTKKEWRKNNIERILLKNKEYYKKNKEAISERQAGYYLNNRDKIIPKLRKYESDRRKVDVGFRISKNLRSRLRLSVKNNAKSDSTKALLGCDIEYLKSHLEMQFKEGMTWDNYGIGGWEIDHIKPCAMFDLSDEIQQRECFHYANLQPLWANENRKKSSVWENEYYELGDVR